ncbi:NYN domain-containing protein [uncultured Corynebacterium sp.]|uniref:NYN domain-containing protein n=1 Tax=uncultured Corynebacterium sp. TaxID=159447 RepID=UPI002618F78C|nr:NYN domain-containing protein [uncultured Corynebacterium sp.]
MLERTMVFVDTSYLLASFYNSWETGARAQLEIDLPEVVAQLKGMIEDQLGQPIHRQMWYDGIPDSGPHRYHRALRACNGVQLRVGQLIEWGERRTQKAVDTRLVADLVLAGVHQTCSDAVLVSGDADMIPGVNEATNAGVRVHLYGFGWDSMSSALRHACDTTTILDPREDFADCMQLHVLEGPLPPVVPSVKPIGDAEPLEVAESTLIPQEAAEAGKPPVAEEPSVEKQEETRPTRPGEPADRDDAVNSLSDPRTSMSQDDDHDDEMMEHDIVTEKPTPADVVAKAEAKEEKKPKPNPSMMAPRRKLRSRYVPLPNEVWASAGFQTPFDVGQQYASWWYDHAATAEQRDSAHLLSGGGLPPEIDRPLLQFACETLHEYTLSETQRVNLRDGFHSGIRGVLVNINNRK